MGEKAAKRCGAGGRGAVDLVWGGRRVGASRWEGGSEWLADSVGGERDMWPKENGEEAKGEMERPEEATRGREQMTGRG